MWLSQYISVTESFLEIKFKCHAHVTVNLGAANSPPCCLYCQIAKNTQTHTQHHHYCQTMIGELERPTLVSNWEHFSILLLYIYIYICDDVRPTVVHLRVSKYTKRIKMADTSATINKKNSNNASSASPRHARVWLAIRRFWMFTTTNSKRQLAMDTAGRRQRLASETAEEQEGRLEHGGELVEGGVLHRRLRNSERRDVDVSPCRGRRRATQKRSFTAHCSGNRYLCTSTIEGKSQLPRSALDRSRSPIMLC